jgi:predicted small metal-binding protein
MTKKLSCSELGVTDCEFTASGETVGNVVEEMVAHLRDKHEINLPDADDILTGEMEEDPLENLDRTSSLVVRRMIEKLEIDSEDNPDLPKPIIGKTTS